MYAWYDINTEDRATLAAMTIIDAIPFPFMLLLVITIVMTQRWRTRNASPPNSQARPTTGVLPSRVAQFSAQDLQQITHGFSEVCNQDLMWAKVDKIYNARILTVTCEFHLH